MSSRYDDRDYDRETHERRSDSDYGRSWGGRSQGRYRYGDNERDRERYGRESGSRTDYGSSRNKYSSGRGEYGGRSEYGGGRSEYGSGRSEYGSGRSEYGGGRGEYRGGGGYQSGSRGEYEGGRQSYSGYERGGWDRERDEDREDRYGGSMGRYGQGYSQSSGGYGEGYNRSRGTYGQGYDRESESRGSGYSGRFESSDYSQRYNYPTGFRSTQEYDDRERSWDYRRGSNYGLGYGGVGSERDYDREDYGRGEERGWWDRASDAVASWFGDEEAERRRRMDRQLEHSRGRGPKGYRRSDDRIKEDINDRLTDDYYLDASDVEVQVTNAEVTLSGTVNARDDKRRAEDIAESVSGVSNVENRIRVKQRGTYENLQSTSSTTGTSSAATGATGTGSTGTGTGTTGTSGMGTTGTTGTGTTGTGVSDTGTTGTSGASRSRTAGT